MRFRTSVGCRRAAPFLAVAAALSVSPGWTQESVLFSQGASAALERHFSRSDLSWLLLDSSGRVLAQRWSSPDLPIAPGSLVKPFIALAYGEQHHFAFPHVECAGTKSRCWLPRGHGSIGIEDAIGRSCNAYFLTLVEGLDRSRARDTLERFGLHGPSRDAPDTAFVGLGDDWQEPPLVLARAYLRLFRTHQPGDEVIATGMRIAAESGTARELDAALGTGAAFAKTGTAVCSHHPRAPADGFSVVVYPTAQPRLLLLVRMHGATGAQTAAVAGTMLRDIGEGAR